MGGPDAPVYRRPGRPTRGGQEVTVVRKFRLSGAMREVPEVDAWFDTRPPVLTALVRPWFARMRACGDDVRVLLHDDQPTACVGDLAFGYVNTFSAHANVGFFVGPELPDPAGLLEGTGKFMRHVKLRPGREVDADALAALVDAAYAAIGAAQS